MKTLLELTRDEKSLLLFFECAAVDYGGTLNTQHMNSDDNETAKRWTNEGFVTFSRIKFHDIKGKRTHAVFLSDNAWQLAHEERRERFNRKEAKRDWQTTSELNAVSER